MDFFDHQDRARRNTGLLLVYFAIAVVLVVASVYVALLSLIVLATKDSEQPIAMFAWHPQLLFSVVGVVTLIIATGSLYKIITLGSNGENVALALGGTKIPPNTTKLEERILLNVVEEMALASGTPVPPVYLLANEDGINAFAAGTTPQNAVIGITRGAIRTLKRDELQGVIAHEFSHILNGDMRLNLRLMGLLHGILLIALIGYLFLRLLGNTASSSSSSSNDDKGSLGIIAALFMLGAALVCIGYVGVFIANLIKAAVSRQREFLADASAVQFTRNPSGIGDALKRIGGWKKHSRLDNARASEASHMFFGEGIVSNLFATHPALPERIKRIDPRFNGVFDETSAVTHSESELIDPRSLSLARASFAGVHVAALAGADRHEKQPNDAVTQIGEPRPEHLVHAQHIVDELDALIAADVRDPLGAVAVIYALLLAPVDDPIRSQQIAIIAKQNDKRVTDELTRVISRVDALSIEQRLPVASLALPALHQMSPKQIDSFRANVRLLIEADCKWTIFEFGIHRFIRKRLANRLRSQGTKPREKFDAPFEPVLKPFQIVLSTLAHAGNQSNSAQKAFETGIAAYQGPSSSLMLVSQRDCTFKSLDQALDALELAKSSDKRKMLEAFSACIASDGKVEVTELELLRIISDAMGCPMPPIVAAGSPA